LQGKGIIGIIIIITQLEKNAQTVFSNF